MGGAIGKASTDIGGFIGNIFTAPFKATIGRSCVNVCLGPWDLGCFIEHFCLPDIAKLLLMSSLCLIILVFITLLFRLGICQCVVKSICKMTCAACATYWLAIGEMVRCCWHSLTNVERVRRRRKRRPDIEADYQSDDEPSSSDSLSHRNITRKWRRGREKLALESKHNHKSCRRHHHHHNDINGNRRLIRLRSRQMSVRIGGKSRRGRSSRKMKSSRVKSNGARVKILKVKDLSD